MWRWGAATGNLLSPHRNNIIINEITKIQQRFSPFRHKIDPRPRFIGRRPPTTFVTMETPATDTMTDAAPDAVEKPEEGTAKPVAANEAQANAGGTAMLNIDEPYMEHSEIAAKNLESNINVADIEKSLGLSSNVAAERLKLYGKNELTPPPKMPEWQRFLLQFKNMFMILLNTCGPKIQQRLKSTGRFSPFSTQN